MKRLTKRQVQLLAALHDTGFIEHSPYFGRSQSNGPLWRLLEAGLAEFNWGPRDSFLMVQGFVPVWTDPVA